MSISKKEFLERIRERILEDDSIVDKIEWYIDQEMIENPDVPGSNRPEWDIHVVDPADYEG